MRTPLNPVVPRSDSKRRFSEFVVRASLAFAILLEVSAANAKGDETFEKTIRCDNSPIVLEIDGVLGSEICRMWEHRMNTALFREASQQFFRFSRVEGGFINVRYLIAGPQKFFGYYGVEEDLKSFSNKLRGKSSDWQRLTNLKAGGKTFEVARFRLPEERYCIGYLTRWLRIYDGWKHKMLGYICTIGNEPELAMAVDLLTKVKITSPSKALAAGIPVKRQSGQPFAFDVKLTSMVFNTSTGQELADDLREISLDHGRIYIYVKWRNLSLEPHEVVATIADGSGRQVFQQESNVTPSNDAWNNWWSYRIDKEVDQPGEWRFQVLMDGEVLVDENLTVRAQ